MKQRCSLAVLIGMVLVLLPSQVFAEDWPEYSEIEPFIDNLVATYPDLCMKYEIGRSVQGRHIWAIRISDNVGVEEDEPEFKYISTMHGDEIIGVMLCMELAEFLLRNYDNNAQAANIVNEVDLWLVPLMNPDGYDRTNRVRANADGYDLNRNFPNYGEANSPVGRPVEVGVIMNWSAQHSFVAAANFHGGALVMNYPFDNYLTGDNNSPDEDEFIYMSEEYSQYNLPMWNGDWYHGRTNGADWYVIDGCMQDWNYHFMGCNEITIELGAKEPDASEITALWNDNRQSMMSYIETCLVGVRGIVTGLSGEPIACTVRVNGRDHDVFTDPDVGDYHRILLGGTYDLTFDAGAIGTKVFTDVVVPPDGVVRLDVSFANAPPVAADVDARTEMEQPITITLQGSDPNGDDIDYIVATLPTNGLLEEVGVGAITTTPYTMGDDNRQVIYTPEAGFSDSDTFTYIVNDGGTPPTGGDSDPGTVTIDVTDPAPIIVTDELPRGVVGEPYGPFGLAAAYGEAPLVWSSAGGDEYTEADLGASLFSEVGVAQGWQEDDARWTYVLPFSFPFYGTEYAFIRINSNGFIDFGSFSGETYTNTSDALRQNRIIAPVWDDLRTDRSGGDIYLLESDDEVTIRWVAVTYSGENPVNVAVTLDASGGIRFDYGPGNGILTASVGISDGNSSDYLFSAYDGVESLTDANSVLLSVPSPLPDGIELSPSGVLSGTPAEVGVFSPEFTVTDSLGRSHVAQIPVEFFAEGWADGDFDGDGDVDLADFVEMQACWHKTATGACSDAFEFSFNGVIDLEDFDSFYPLVVGP